MTTVTDLSKIDARDLAADLMGSAQPTQTRRAGHDIAMLLELEQHEWRHRFGIVSCALNPADRTVALLCALRAAGLVCLEDPATRLDPQPCDTWYVVLSLALEHYRDTMPGAVFVGSGAGPDIVPFASHVIDRRCLPDLSHITPALQQVVREGSHGHACALEDWAGKDATERNLAVLVFQLSRIVTLVARGEGDADGNHNLNRLAFDYTQRWRHTHPGHTGLGPALPVPLRAMGDAADEASIGRVLDTGDDDSMDWDEEEGP